MIQINIDDRKDNRRATISIYAETEDAAKKARQVNIFEFSPNFQHCCVQEKPQWKKDGSKYPRPLFRAKDRH